MAVVAQHRSLKRHALGNRYTVLGGPLERTRIDGLNHRRTRRGARTACATLLSWATLVAVTFVFGVAEPLPIALFSAGAYFFGALLVTDPHRGDRVRTVGLASVVSAVAVVVTVELSQTAVWAAAAFLVLQMFLSYALRSWSPRAGTLAVIGALTPLFSPVPGTSPATGSDGSCSPRQSATRGWPSRNTSSCPTTRCVPSSAP